MQKIGYAMMAAGLIGAAWVLFEKWDEPEFWSRFAAGIGFLYFVREGSAFVDAADDENRGCD